MARYEFELSDAEAATLSDVIATEVDYAEQRIENSGRRLDERYARGRGSVTDSIFYESAKAWLSVLAPFLADLEAQGANGHLFAAREKGQN